jgi:SAM-dependent methyltransferase
MATPDVNLWTSPAHALEYLGRADKLPHRTEGEAMLLECLPRPLGRVLDLGSGDGRLLALVGLARPEAAAVALDFSPPMLDRLRTRFAADPSVEVLAHDLHGPLPALGAFQAVHRMAARARRPVQQATGRGDATRLVARDRVRRCRLPVEVAGTGAAGRRQTRLTIRGRL